MKSEVLADAAAAKTLDVAAKQFCNDHIHGPDLIAALDSTAGEIRQIASEVEVRGPWQDGLPSGDDEPVWICVFDVAGLPGLEDGLTYMAYWGVISASQNLTAW
ncbi:hypothetical protein IWX81_000968 [Salinibacterium sp. CAN_S4]|uniref:hypothetical protein n=1 Tax=Salinibacterium sp. CAN_S4 TaxID=2787727 RepID=UPI0018EF9578